MLTRRRIVVLPPSRCSPRPRSRRTSRSSSRRPPRRRIRPVRAHPAAVQGQDRHRREGRVAGHRPGARYRPARRRRRGLRPRQAAGGEVRRRRLRREAPSGDVQRLHPGRAQERPRRRQGQGHHRRIEGDQGQGSTVHLARRPVGHPPPSLHCGSSPAWTSRAPTRAVVPRDRPGNGSGAQHRLRLQRLCARRPRHLALVQEPRRPRHRGRRRQQALQPVRRDPGESGQACAREEGPRPGLHRLAHFAGGQKAIADYKINGEQLFFPNATVPGA